MSRSSHRLDLVLVAPLFVTDLSVEVAALVARGVLAADGGPGPGFVAWRAESGPVRLWANQLGGFRVRCPNCSANLVSAFAAAWRSHPPPLTPLRCAACDRVTPLTDLDFAPPAAFARAAIVLADVRDSAVADPLLAAWPEGAPVPRVIARRP